MTRTLPRHLLPATLLTAVFAQAAPADQKAEDASVEEAMEEVVVVAGKIERPVQRVASQVSRINQEQLRWQQAASFSEIARYEPGVDAGNQGARFGEGMPSIRGIGGDRVTLELDGVPMPQHMAVGAFANSPRTALDPGIIDRVEILRGPASSIYGSDAIAGVISVTTANAAELAANGRHLSVGSGYFDADDGALAYISSAASSSMNDVLISLNHRVGNERDNSASPDRAETTQRQLYAKWTHYPSSGARLRTTVDLYRRRVDSDLNAVLGYGRQYRSTVDLLGRDSQARRRASIKYIIGPSGPLTEASIQLFHQVSDTTQNTRDFRGPALDAESNRLIERTFDFRETVSGIEAMGRADFAVSGTRHILVAGIEVDQRQLRESRDGSDTDLLTGAISKVLPPGELLPQRDLPRTDVVETGLYFQDEIVIGKTTLIPGLRWDRFNLDARTDALFTHAGRITNLDNDQWSARLGITHRLTDRWSLYGHAAQGFRAPPAQDVNLILEYTGSVTVRALPNPDLVPETSTSAEVGLRYTSAPLAIEVGVYHSRFNDFIESRIPVGVDPADGALLFQSRNLSQATIYGVEGSISASLAEAGFPGWSATAGVHASRGRDEQAGGPLNSISPAKAVLGLRWQDKGSLAASLRITHHARQTRTNFSDGEFFVPPSATVVDVIGRWRPISTAEVFFGLYNIADRKYWRYSDAREFVPGDPRIEARIRTRRNAAITFHLNL